MLSLSSNIIVVPPVSPSFEVQLEPEEKFTTLMTQMGLEDCNTLASSGRAML